MKARSVVPFLFLTACCFPRLFAQSNPSHMARNNAELHQWVSTEKKLAAEGHADAQFTVGSLYYFGIGIPQDYANAATWFRKAAEQGDAGAQFMLGDLYSKGQGIPQSYSEAYFWLDLAATRASGTNLLGQMPVSAMRDEAASHLTRAELSQVQKRAERWFESHKSKPPAQ